MRKYLEEINVSEDEICIPNTKNKDDSSERYNNWMKQRKEYGFDDRETWSLDYTFAVWLYEHLRMYQDIAGKTVDLSFHRFNVPVIVEAIKEEGNSSVKTEIQEKTQEESINLCIEYLKEFFRLENDLTDIEYELSYEYRRVAVEIFSKILNALWW